MALINCPECQNQISDKARSCPHCGFDQINESSLNELKAEIANTREDINKGMFGKDNTEIAGKIGAGCVITVVIIILIVFLIALA